MDDITNYQDDNLGGCSLIRFAPLRFFATLNPVTFKSGCDWINVFCTTETMQFTEQATDDDNCGFQQVVVSGQVPRIRADIHANIQKYRLQQVIVQCQDMNGNLRQAGTLENGMVLSDNSSTGTVTADPNGYSFKFTGLQLQTSAFL